MKQARRISKSLLDAALIAEIDGKLGGNTPITWEQITGKPQLADNAWGTPVANVAMLPATGRFDGDVRLVLDTNEVFAWETREDKWVLIGANDVNVDWGHIQAKPDTFPASPHTHAYDTLTGVPASFPPQAHTHAYDTLTGTPDVFKPEAHDHDDRYYTESETDTLLEEKANVTHTHNELHTHENQGTLDKLTDAELERIASHETRLNNIESGYTVGHAHSNLAALNVLTYSGDKAYVDLHGIEANAAALLGKAEKSTVTAHVDNTSIHITNTERNAWNDKADAGHTHSYSSLTGVPDTFAPSAHSHTYNSLSGIPLTFTPSTHTHAATDITGLAPSVSTGDVQPVNGAETWYKVIG